MQFLDVVDGSIVNVALPSIQHDLHFSQQNLQWVASGYVLTYGGFLLLGGRAADLLGRRRMLVAGVLLFACCSLAGGLARNESTLIAARLAQGLGAALMAPAALSLVTTLFKEGVDRHKALGIWGAISGLGAAAGVFFGGVLSEGPGWRWVLFVNLPFCALILVGAFRLLSGDRPAGAAAKLRRARRRPRHRRDAPARLRADQGARARLGQPPHARLSSRSPASCSPPSCSTRHAAANR